MQNKERIEGLVETKAIQDFKTSVNTIIVDMTNDGYEYEEVAEYMLSVINGTIRSHKNEDAKNQLIGKRVVVVDEMGQKNNIKVLTISDFDPEGMMWFKEEEEGSITHIPESEVDKFISGTKVYIHPDEVYVQLVD